MSLARSQASGRVAIQRLIMICAASSFVGHMSSSACTVPTTGRADRPPPRLRCVASSFTACGSCGHARLVDGGRWAVHQREKLGPWSGQPRSISQLPEGGRGGPTSPELEVDAHFKQRGRAWRRMPSQSAAVGTISTQGMASTVASGARLAEARREAALQAAGGTTCDALVPRQLGV